MSAPTPNDPNTPGASSPHPPYLTPDEAAQHAAVAPQWTQPAPAQSAPAGAPPVAGGQPAPPVATPPRRRSGRAWMWWLLGVVVLLVIFGCAIGTWQAISGLGRGGSSSGTGDTVAVIHMDGTIAGTGTAPTVVTPEAFLKLLKRANDDDNIKAIVLRVNSPGGTVAASEEIASFVHAEKKPVVVSVSDVDASGAYMVSSQSRWIVANPGSAVGSIGVITEIPNVQGLLNKLGVQFKVIHAGKFKDAGSPYRDMTPEEIGLIQGQVDQVYGQFIDIVSSGRKLDRSKVESMATGWAWNAAEAKNLGLVDQLGTYQDALDKAAKLGHIEGDYQTDVLDESPFTDLFGSLLGGSSQLQQLGSSLLAPTSIGGSALAK